MLLPWVVGTARTWRMAQASAALEGEEWQELSRAAGSELSVRRLPRLRRSPEEVVPMVWGWMRPTILLPAGAEEWTRERRWLVLLHELAHVKRGDCLVQALAHLCCALYWCNPLAWLAAHRLRRERERACDDLVLAAGLKPSEYATHLVDLARSLRQPGLATVAAVPMARQAGLMPRIRDLLESGRSRRRVSRRGAVISLLALVALLIVLARVPTFNAKSTPRPNGVQQSGQTWLGQPVPPGDVTIGAVLPLSGERAKYGLAAKQAIDLAVQDLNSRNRAHEEANLSVIYEDSGGTPEGGVSAFQRLATRNQVPIVIGDLFSSVTLAMAPLAEKCTIVLLSPTSSAARITGAGDYVFRNCVSDTFDGAALGRAAPPRTA